MIADALLAVVHAAAALFSVLFAIGHLSWHEFEVLGAVATFVAFGFFAASENTSLEEFILRHARAFIGGFIGLVTVALLGSQLVADTNRPNIVFGFAMASVFSALATYYVSHGFAILKKSP